MASGDHKGCPCSGCCVLVLSLPLGLVVVAVAAVKLTEHLPDSGLQAGVEELDIPLHAEVHDVINPFREVQLDIRPQGYLERAEKEGRYV